jgi:hypothetical protein
MKKEPRLTANTYKILAAIMGSENRELAGAGLLLKTGLMSGTLYPSLLKLN